MRPLQGKPLFHWILESLNTLENVNEIIVDTDSNSIADSAKKFSKVRVLMRPESLRGDFVPMNDLIRYQLQNSDNDFFLQTHSTNPLLKSETICKAIELFLNQDKHDSLFSVTRFQSRFYWKDAKPINHDPKILLRTQDLPPIYEENSNFYIFSKKSFQQNNHRIGQKPILYELNKIEALDIDEELDFQLAEHLMGLRLKA